MDQLLYRPKQAAQVLGISRDKLYEAARVSCTPGYVSA